MRPQDTPFTNSSLVALGCFGQALFTRESYFQSHSTNSNPFISNSHINIIIHTKTKWLRLVGAQRFRRRCSEARVDLEHTLSNSSPVASKRFSEDLAAQKARDRGIPSIQTLPHHLSWQHHPRWLTVLSRILVSWSFWRRFGPFRLVTAPPAV